MRQFRLRLRENNQRPVMILNKNTSAMLDTGSIFPVWVQDEKILVDYMQGELINETVCFGGFGGETTGRLYKLPLFKIGELEYPNLYVIEHRMNLPFHMIISATMLSRLRYEIDDENHVLTVTIPDRQSQIRRLTVADSQGKLHVLCVDAEKKTA